MVYKTNSIRANLKNAPGSCLIYPPDKVKFKKKVTWSFLKILQIKMIHRTGSSEINSCTRYEQVFLIQIKWELDGTDEPIGIFAIQAML